MTEIWRRRLLYLAGAWNILGGLSALADPARHFAQLYAGALALSDPIQAFFFRATWINVIGWGIGYVLAARHPAARGPILVAGAAGKLAYFGACAALVASGVGRTGLLVAGLVDVVAAGFFVSIVWRGRPEQPTAA